MQVGLEQSARRVGAALTDVHHGLEYTILHFVLLIQLANFLEEGRVQLFALFWPG